MANLSPDVIRSWERRYKIVEPNRDVSGVRLYSDRDVERLTLARKATRQGHPIRHVAGLSDEQLEKLVEPKPRQITEENEVVARLLDAIHRNDLGTASHILRTATLLTGVHQLVLKILAPALREIGLQWEREELAVWQEHFLSNQIAGVAASLQYTPAGNTCVIFATPPFERHGFGIALASLLAAGRGVRACNLGVTVPATELIAAARRLGAAAVVVGLTQQTFSDTEAVKYAMELDAGLPASVELMFGGTGSVRVVGMLQSPRIRAVATLETFDGLCALWR